MTAKVLCSKCGFVYDQKTKSCPVHGPDVPVLLINDRLCKTVELLIKLGIGVIDTGIRYSTDNRTEIEIFLAGNIPDDIFDDLPEGWIQTNGKLICCAMPDDIGDSTAAAGALIEALENWLSDKDADAFKAILLLFGYI